MDWKSKILIPVIVAALSGVATYLVTYFTSLPDKSAHDAKEQILLINRIEKIENFLNEHLPYKLESLLSKFEKESIVPLREDLIRLRAYLGKGKDRSFQKKGWESTYDTDSLKLQKFNEK